MGIGNVVQEEIYASLRKINEDAAKAGAVAGTDQRKIGDFWATAMDEAKANREGLTPLKAELDSIEAIATVRDVLDVAFALHQLGVDVLFSANVSQSILRHYSERYSFVPGIRPSARRLSKL
jgi:putative endopeptidase